MNYNDLSVMQAERDAALARVRVLEEALNKISRFACGLDSESDVESMMRIADAALAKEELDGKE